MTLYVRIVPSIRTIPGVDQFDYAIEPDDDVRIGDLLRVPFRKKMHVGLCVSTSTTSVHAEKTIVLTTPIVLLRLGKVSVALLRKTAEHTFTSLPTVLYSWIRRVPTRKIDVSESAVTCRTVKVRRREQQLSLTQRSERLLVDRWEGTRGLIAEAKKSHERVLILTPWKERADRLAHLLKTQSLHADLSMTTRWNRVHDFVTGERRMLVATRIGAWLSSVADTVLIDEPENDDHKQDELAPRIDARWMVECAAHARADLRVVSFGTTPRLGATTPRSSIPDIRADIAIEPWRKRFGSSIELLSPNTVQKIECAVADGRAVTILHPIRGVRSRVSCHDCGWRALCASCGWTLSLGERKTFCKRCGRNADIPLSCPSCGGTDFLRGLPGMEELRKQCDAAFGPNRVRVDDMLGFERDTRSLVIITDLSLLAGATEDIRRRERLIIAWRRIAAACETMHAHLCVQGSEELMGECRSWLTVDGFTAAWKKECHERRVFGFPPAVRLVKLLCDGTADHAQQIVNDLRTSISSDWSVNGPYPVPFRAATRTPRYVIHLIGPLGSDPTVYGLPSSVCHIDLDPVAFFG